MWESMVKYCIVKKERGETIITNHVAKLTGDQIYIKYISNIYQRKKIYSIPTATE